MSVIPGVELRDVWMITTKKRVCVETWSMVAKLRRIEKTSGL